MKRISLPPSVTRYALYLVPLTLVFSAAWIPLAKAGLSSGFSSYAVAIPFICAWLISQRLNELPTTATPSRLPAILLILASLTCAAISMVGRKSGWFEARSSWITLEMFGWVLGAWAGGFWFFGADSLRKFAFPWGYLIFTVPPPARMLDAMEAALQHGSAAAVEMVFRIGRVTYSRDGSNFWLPGLHFDIAPECSGIRATLVLLLTSLLGAYMILRSPWRRTVLVLLVLPLGIARNTLRICTITLLSAFHDPTIIDGPLHHKGGPVFFAISLIPFFAVIAWFRRQENRSEGNPNPTALQHSSPQPTPRSTPTP
jgi:exosortase C (VPDSG-CTERM-specific)